MRLLLTQYAGGQHDIQTEPEDKVNRDAHHDGDHREQDDPFDAPLLFGRQDSDLCKQVHDGAEEEARRLNDEHIYGECRDGGQHPPAVSLGPAG